MTEKTETTKPEEKNEEKKGTKGKLIAVLILTILLAGGVAAGIYFVRRSMGYLTTDNARITTTLVHIAPNIPGQLESFALYQGQRVRQNEVLGWVQGGEAMRSPVDGIIVNTNAVPNQVVSPMQPIAVIADTGGIHIQANIRETDIAQLQIGQPAFVTIDGLGNRRFNGYISNIGMVTQAELAGTALFFNTGGTFTRVTHLIPIEIIITDDISLDSLIGTNARVSIPLRTPTPVELQEPIAPSNITTSGIVESATTRNIYSSPLGLRVERIYARAGDYVTEGQLLAIMDAKNIIEDLTLAVAQQESALEIARITSQNAVGDAQRMFDEATANLAGNTNFNILSAETALTAAVANLELSRLNHSIALEYHQEGSNPQILGAESLVRSARTQFEAIERSHADAIVLYAAGIISAEAFRQSEDALTQAQNMYADALTGYEAANTHLHRSLEQAEIALSAAVAAHRDTENMLRVARSAAGQEVEALRSLLANAQAAANLEQLEIALRQTQLQLDRHMEDAIITAPVSGTLTSVFAREGTAGMGLMFTIEDTADLRIITSFREYDVGKIEPGMEVTITTIAGGSEYTGVITRINPAVIPGSPVVEFEAEIAVTSADTSLRIGMNVRVNVTLQ